MQSFTRGQLVGFIGNGHRICVCDFWYIFHERELGIVGSTLILSPHLIGWIVCIE